MSKLNNILVLQLLSLLFFVGFVPICCDNENDFPHVVQHSLAEVQSQEARIKREETQSVLVMG